MAVSCSLDLPPPYIVLGRVFISHVLGLGQEGETSVRVWLGLWDAGDTVRGGAGFAKVKWTEKADNEFCWDL